MDFAEDIESTEYADYDVLRESKVELESGVLRTANMYSTLRQYFGYTSFRPLQEEIVNDVLDGKDVFVLMPTGGGKSLCYQLPALLQAGVTVVVSPLISLMKDQVDGLEANGVAAACMNSTQSAREIRDVKNAFLENRLKVLYVAPERLMMPGTLTFLKKGKVSLFAIDEAHCISEWGHDFRPEYRKLKLLRGKEKGFSDVPVIALTATATERVKKDIITQLGLELDPETGPYVASFDRRNLYYEVRPKKETFSEITDHLRRHRGDAGIIYCQSRNNVENLANKLTRAGFRALPYHAGLSDTERSRNQELFIKDDADIIVATIAFGMGIDKSNVRFVIHYDLPRNLESYYQETGRGGRDGSPCECILFFSRGDRFKIEYFINQKTNEKEKDIALVQLRQMVAYCENNKCRRQTLLEYFGEILPEACGNCDGCLQPKSTFDGTEAAKKLVACVMELNQRFGTNYAIDVLMGSKNKKIKQNHHERLKAHGNGREFTKEQWRALASEMINTGLLEVSGARYPVLKLNAMSRKILRGSEKVELVCPSGFVPEIEDDGVPSPAPEMAALEMPPSGIPVPGMAAKAGKKKRYEPEEGTEDYPAVANIMETVKARSPAKSGEDIDQILFERLKTLRKQIAVKKNLPPYIIFSDTSLKEMAAKFPKNNEEFHAIPGVGDHKLRKYGDVFLREIENYCLDYGLEAPENVEDTEVPGDKAEGISLKPDLCLESGPAWNPEPDRAPESGRGSHTVTGVETEVGTYVDGETGVEVQNKVLTDVQNEVQNESSPEAFGSLPDIGKKVPLRNPVSPARKGRLLATSIEDWTEKAPALQGDSAPSGNSDPIDSEKLSASLEETFSLCGQGLGISEIAEIQGLGTGTVCKQLEQLILAGKIRDIEGFLPPEKRKQFKTAVEDLEAEFSSLLKDRFGENFSEGELKLVKALLFSRLLE